MSTSVFGTDTGKPLVFKAGKAIVTINGQTLIAIDASINFARTVEVVSVIGRKRIISLGEPRGTFSTNTMLAKSSNVFEAFGMDGNSDCGGFDITISFGAGSGSCDLSGKTMTCKNCFASGMTITASGERGFVASAVQVTFTALELDSRIG